MKILPSIFAVLQWVLPLAWLLVTVLMTADAADGGEWTSRQSCANQSAQLE